MNGKELQIIALIVAIVMFFYGEAKAESSQQKENWQAAGYDATCITACPTCTIYNHPNPLCRAAIAEQYKRDVRIYLEYKRKAIEKERMQSERSTNNQ